MTALLHQLDRPEHGFPNPEHALTNPDGLLAIGGCLSTTRLQDAYSQGIFPWFSEGEPIMWWSPSERAIIALDDFHVSKSLKKSQRRLTPTVTLNHAFEEVITQCQEQRADTEGTWITEQMYQAYVNLHKKGFAHSLEVWVDGELCGGLYGVMQSAVFCGESMFHTRTDCSKLAMWALVNLLKKHNAAFIDCQLVNPYLQQLGAKPLPRKEFLAKLKEHNNAPFDLSFWRPSAVEDPYGTASPGQNRP